MSEATPDVLKLAGFRFQVSQQMGRRLAQKCLGIRLIELTSSSLTFPHPGELFEHVLPQTVIQPLRTKFERARK